MIKLKCILPYRNDPRGWLYKPGTVFDATEADAKFLLADAPGCFEVVKPKAKRVGRPPKDKMVAEPTKEK